MEEKIRNMAIILNAYGDRIYQLEKEVCELKKVNQIQEKEKDNGTK